ncbi:MAG: hypothetical protein JWN88_2656 [Frankiales bacterium]|jgi:fermentation-respiration switch protein FrsA (DUF1100 family)|nr:hypothetical protein [Frankiales bacterium]
MSSVGEFNWKLIGLTSGVLAAKVSRSVAEKIWVKTKGGDPPRNPASRETSWGEALGWAVATGVAAGVARLLASRGAAQAWQKTTGKLPPGLEEVGN